MATTGLVALAADVPNAGASTASGPTFTWAFNSSPRSLFGPTDYDSTMMNIMTLIYGTELVYSNSGKLEPEIVTSWKAVNPTTYVYHVRPGVKFSNGAPVTAADVAYSLNLQLTKKLASEEVALFAAVKSITAKGDTVTVRLSSPTSFWQYVPATIAGYVYDPASVKKDLTGYGSPSAIPVGAGPYMVSKDVPNSEVTLVRNPHYYGKPGRYAKIVFDIIPDQSTMLLALEQGTIDGTSDLTTPLVTLRKDATVKLVPELAWFGLTLDMQEKPFNTLHVREALYLATNRTAILGPKDDRTGTLSVTVNTPSIFYGVLPKREVKRSYAKIKTFPYNPTAAKKQLAQSKYPHGFKVTLNVPETDTSDIKNGQILEAEWAQIGVTLHLKLMPGGPRFQVILNHGPTLGVQIIGNLPTGPDPVQMAYEYFSRAQAAKGGNNSSNYKNAKVNKLLDEANSSTTAVKAAKLTLQAQVLASKAVPVVPFNFGDYVLAVHKGWKIGQLGTFFNSTVNWVTAFRAP